MSRISFAVLFLFFFSATSVRAALYADLPDEKLARRSPVIVIADVIDVTSRLERIDGEQRPWTFVTLERSEALRGFSPGVFKLLLPGGTVGNLSWSEPGTPSFKERQRVVLFLAPVRGRSGEYQLTEFALSKFELVEDQMGEKFAVRGLFRSGTQQMVSPENPARMVRDGARKYDSFLEALRLFGEGEPMPQVVHGHPSGRLRHVNTVVRDSWVNIGGREPANNFRWFWDTGTSPDAVATIVGLQTNLRDGSNGTPQVQYSLNTWSGVANSRVRYTGITAAGGNLTVNLDLSVLTGRWTAAMDCSLGILGVAGPGPSSGPFVFKGNNYFAIRNGNINMRRNICASGYDPLVFRAAMLHEMGHTLGLGHPDQGQSTSSTTTQTDWQNAVMTSSLTQAAFNGPQNDDIQAILFYYPSGTSIPAPTITSLTPTSGTRLGGTLVSITGTNFVAGATVDFGGNAAASVTFVSSTSLQAVTPSASAFTANVTVRNPDGQSVTRPLAFEFLQPPAITITGVSPRSGPAAGGTSITISGTGFTLAPLTVTVGGVTVLPVSLSTTSLSIVTPARTAGNATVAITAGATGSASLANGFTYLLANAASGDVDGNGSVGVSDVFYLINSLFAGGPPPVGNGDPNRDSTVAVSDIFYLINFLFAGGAAPL